MALEKKRGMYGKIFCSFSFILFFLFLSACGDSGTEKGSENYQKIYVPSDVLPSWLALGENSKITAFALEDDDVLSIKGGNWNSVVETENSFIIIGKDGEIVDKVGKSKLLYYTYKIEKRFLFFSPWTEKKTYIYDIYKRGITEVYGRIIDTICEDESKCSILTWSSPASFYVFSYRDEIWTLDEAKRIFLTPVCGRFLPQNEGGKTKMFYLLSAGGKILFSDETFQIKNDIAFSKIRLCLEDGVVYVFQNKIFFYNFFEKKDYILGEMYIIPAEETPIKGFGDLISFMTEDGISVVSKNGEIKTKTPITQNCNLSKFLFLSSSESKILIFSNHFPNSSSEVIYIVRVPSDDKFGVSCPMPPGGKAKYEGRFIYDIWGKDDKIIIVSSSDGVFSLDAGGGRNLSLTRISDSPCFLCASTPEGVIGLSPERKVVNFENGKVIIGSYVLSFNSDGKNTIAVKYAQEQSKDKITVLINGQEYAQINHTVKDESFIKSGIKGDYWFVLDEMAKVTWIGRGKDFATLNGVIYTGFTDYEGGGVSVFIIREKGEISFLYAGKQSPSDNALFSKYESYNIIFDTSQRIEKAFSFKDYLLLLDDWGNIRFFKKNQSGVFRETSRLSGFSAMHFIPECKTVVLKDSRGSEKERKIPCVIASDRENIYSFAIFIPVLKLF